MKFKLFTLLLLFLFIFLCKKSVTVLSGESGLNNSYFQCQLVLIWVYQWYKIDFMEGAEMVLEGKIDTLKILGDSLIGFHNYRRILWCGRQGSNLISFLMAQT
jgi:hypothetical protein